MTDDETMDYQTELEETQRALREVTLMIEQSQGELAKITQRNTAITSHLQQLQKQGTAVEDLKMSYDSALDVQQRLFVMRGQLEKLQNDKDHLGKYKGILEKIVSGGMSGDTANSSTPAVNTKSQMAGIEMSVSDCRVKCTMALPRRCQILFCKLRLPCVFWMWTRPRQETNWVI
jgi:hypothetical protein